jgi:hypothetical protein
MMGDVVNLRSVPIDINSDVGHQWVVDCCRAGEGLITDRELAEKYELSPADWQAITKDKALGHAIRAERDRRVRNGTAVREAAAKHLVKGPGILDGIMTNEQSNPRHKIEAFKELRQTAAIGDGAEGRSGERFVIQINIGADTETYNKSLAVDPNDTDPNNVTINLDEGHVEQLDKPPNRDEHHGDK